MVKEEVEEKYEKFIQFVPLDRWYAVLRLDEKEYALYRLMGMSIHEVEYRNIYGDEMKFIDYRGVTYHDSWIDESEDEIIGYVHETDIEMFVEEMKEQGVKVCFGMEFNSMCLKREING